jgi:predicted amidohydrolase
MSSPSVGTFQVGLVQMRTGRDVGSNLADAARLIRQAAAQGAQYVQTPEITTIMELDRKRLVEALQPEEGNTAVSYFSDLAKELGIWLHIGSMAVLLDTGKMANRAFLFAPDGAKCARFDKIHMFDVELPGGETYRESKNYQAGGAAVLAPLPWGVLGLTICYDLRFPHLYRALAKAGADFLAIPSAFTQRTGAAHWHTLLRARAIESGCFVFAAAQAGKHECGRETYGHSLVVSPWGDIIAEAVGQDPGTILATIDPQAVLEARRAIPSLQHDRPFDVITAGVSVAT